MTLTLSENVQNSGGLMLAFARSKTRVRDLHGLPETLARAGSLELKLATSRKEIRKAQKLRYRVFFEEGNAIPEPYVRLRRRDICNFDRICDHLIVIDHASPKRKVVGCYRLLRQEVAQANGGFYSAQEFDIAPLLARHCDKRFLELGRSCVAREHRGKRVLELLWRGLWTYARHHACDVMIGCASLPGADAGQHVGALTFLRDHAAAPAEWRASALPARRVDVADEAQPESRRSLAALPPLVKGYLRVGAYFGDGAVVDRQFGTTDVLVVVPIARIDARYVDHFSAGALAA
jgi:putative hemolysin